MNKTQIPWTGYAWNPVTGCAAALKFLSCEPLLEDVGVIDLSGIGWAIVGGEAGPGWRPMPHALARSIRDQCAAAGVAFFFKQSAGYRSGLGVELIDTDGSRAMQREFPP